jgi:probable phosphoglycerate mutase
MELLLARHGNTFGPGDPVVWAGTTNDLPLVEKGVEQAHRLADALKKKGIKPAAIYCGPLQRTKHYAQILVDDLKLPFSPTVDSRLNEIDYGEWTGLSNEEVIARFGEAELKKWDEHCQWPDQGNWGGSPQEVEERVQSFVADLKNKHHPSDTVVIVSSNGKLRYFLKLDAKEFENRIRAGTFKVKTGNICKVVINGDHYTIPYWNEPPATL